MILMTAALGLGCNGPRKLTPEEQKQVSDLKAELATIDQELAAIQTEDKLYSGGLIKSLIAVRQEVVKTTRALVQQRIHAIESGAPIKVETVIATPDRGRADQLAQELATQTSEVKAARAEAELYSGGLVGALKASTVATQENTLAMLRQQYVMAKYGLVTPTAKPIAESPSGSQEKTQANSTVDAAPLESPIPKAKPFEIVDVDSRVTEANSSWSKYAWKLTIRNMTADALALEAVIEFLDADGFVVDDDREYNLMLGPNQEQTFTGYDLIDASAAPRVTQVNAKVKER